MAADSLTSNYYYLSNCIQISFSWMWPHLLLVSKLLVEWWQNWFLGTLLFHPRNPKSSQLTRISKQLSLSRYNIFLHECLVSMTSLINCFAFVLMPSCFSPTGFRRRKESYKRLQTAWEFWFDWNSSSSKVCTHASLQSVFILSKFCVLQLTRIGLFHWAEEHLRSKSHLRLMPMVF